MGHFNYHQPATLAEALKLLGELGPKALPVAGATDVWVNLRLKKIAPEALVSLRGLSELNFAKSEKGALKIGAATPHAVFEDCAWTAKNFPALSQACGAVGSRQVRNVATVGGNICNGAPSADSAVPLLLYDATLVVKSAQGERTLPVTEFFRGPGKTALNPGEILAEIHLPAQEGTTYSGYIKHTRRKAMELPLLGVGALVTVDKDRNVTRARIALGVAGPTPLRIAKAEEALVGKKLTLENVKAAAQIAAEEAQVRDSWRSKAWYRRDMIKALIPRALAEAGAFAE